MQALTALARSDEKELLFTSLSLALWDFASLGVHCTRHHGGAHQQDHKYKQCLAHALAAEEHKSSKWWNSSQHEDAILGVHDLQQPDPPRTAPLQEEVALWRV